MLLFLAQTFCSTVLGMMMAEALKPSDSPPPSKKAVAGMPYHVGLADTEGQGTPTGASAGSGTGHYTPLDVLWLESALRDIAADLRGSPGIGYDGKSVRKGRNTMSAYDIVGSIGADLMFGADDSDVLEALSVSGDGSSEIIGGVTDYIGAELIGAAKAGNPRAQAALRKIAMRNAGAVVKNDLKNRRRYPLGFVPTEVDAGDSATIPAAPQNLFRPERLVIPSDICFDFGIQDVKVGNQSQFVQSVEVPAAVFSEVSIDTNVTFDTAEVGNQISILVRNKGTTDDLEFTAAALGTIAKS